MKLRGLSRLLALLAAVTGTLIFSGSAVAAVTSSNITTPGDPTYLQRNDDNASAPGNTFTVSGTTVDDGTPGNVDLVCVGTGTPTGSVVVQTMASDVTVNYSGN